MTAEMQTQPARKTPLHAESVADLVALAINQHRIAPGAKLGEEELAEIYGVSRTIIRAALHDLAHRQLVETHRNRGAFVARPSIREAHEVFEARALLEPGLARRAAERASAEDLALLADHSAQEHAALEAGDRGAALHLSGQFHTEIARIADHGTIAGFVNALVARSSLIIALYWRRESALCESHAHDALLDALGAGDGAAAEELMKSHLVDLHSALDLRDRPAPSLSLKEALSR